MNTIWTLLLTACMSDTDCISQRVDTFTSEQLCVASQKLHTEIPVDGSWKQITYQCKPLGSRGV